MMSLAWILAQAQARESLTSSGMVVMCLCIALVLGLNIFCMSRVLRPRESKDK